MEAANVQFSRGADQLATSRQRKADPSLYRPAHKIVVGKRGEHRCQILRTDVLDGGGKVGREHDHGNGTESVMPVSNKANTAIVDSSCPHFSRRPCNRAR